VIPKSSIRLLPDDGHLIRHLYLADRIPIDQYEKRPADLVGFVAKWNRLSGRDDSVSDVLHYMRTARKRGKWPRLNGDHERCPEIPEEVLTASQWVALREVYASTCLAQGVGSDSISHDEELAKQIADEFAKCTGLIRDPRYLLALLMQKRKQKQLKRLRDEKPRRPDIGFGDIDEIAS
jgi:hypothetical protein